MPDGRFDLNDACDMSAAIVARNPEMERLYLKAVRYIGVGELRNRIMELAAEAIQDSGLREESLVSHESMVSLFCGIWIQFLLVEIGGLGREELRSLAQQIFSDMQENRTIH